MTPTAACDVHMWPGFQKEQSLYPGYLVSIREMKYTTDPDELCFEKDKPAVVVFFEVKPEQDITVIRIPENEGPTGT